MSIKFTNARQISTNPNTVIWDNQPQAALSLFFRYETAGGVAAAQLNTNYFLWRGLGSFYAYMRANGTPNSLDMKFNVQNTALAGAAKQLKFNVGTAYHIAITYDQGQQILWVNGTPYTMGTLTGNTRSQGGAGWPIDIGAMPVAGTPVVYTMDKLHLWNGYAPTAEEIAFIRDGGDPTTIGPGATGRWYWTMDGTTDATVTVGDPGLANGYGDTEFDIKFLAGSGSSVYSAPLAFVPSVSAEARVTSGGKNIRFVFHAISDGSVVVPTALSAAPRVSVRGADRGALIIPWVTGRHKSALFGMPDGVKANPSDVVTLDAPIGWMMTAIGISGGMAAQVAENCTGRSAYGTDAMKKTFRPGWNNAHIPQNISTYSIPKNWRYRCDFWTSGTVLDGGGKPVSNPTQATIGSFFYKLGAFNGIDQTTILPVGFWAIKWDDLDPTHPTTCSLFTASSGNINVTERPEYNNPGSGGVGKVRVYEVTAITPVVVGAANVSLGVNINNAAKAFHFDNLVIHGPGDFNPGAPTVLDDSDPYAISGSYRARLANGAGSLRFGDSAFGYGVFDQMAQPDEVFELTDFSWGVSTGTINKGVTWTQGRPWDQATTPYVYGTLFGDPFPATLSSPIPNGTDTVIMISDAATAPVIVGLLLQVEDEIMRVVSVSGTSVTVDRGACNTTAMAHSAGAIQVKNRWDARGKIPRGQFAEIVSATPHGISTGQMMPAVGPWPSWRFADGSYNFHNPTPISLSGNKLLTMVTGTNTVVVYCFGTQAPWTTLDGPYAMGTASLQSTWPGPDYPVPFIAKTAGRFGECDLHMNMPNATSDALAYKFWTEVRDNYPAGRNIWFEYSDEPWNFRFPQYNMILIFSNWLYPSSGQGWEFYLSRAARLRAIGREVFGPRAGEIKWLINNNRFDPSGTAARLEFARTVLGEPIDAVAIATYQGYQGLDSSLVTQQAYWQYDDEQAIDLWIANLRDDTSGYPAIFVTFNSVIDAYNAKYGEHVVMYAYEGGSYMPAPALETTLSSGVDASTTEIPVASGTLFVAGMPILCESEWMTVTGPPMGNTVPVVRGQYGSVQASHGIGKGVRSAYIERGHDLNYNPNWYFAEREENGFWQSPDGPDGRPTKGPVRVNRYALCMGSAEYGTYYGAYHSPWQQAGRGDGSDGKSDNRLVLACPGKAHTKPAGVNQDSSCVSVRGYAHLRWMMDTIPMPAPVSSQYRDRPLPRR